jgi:hypothetical protein
MKGMLQVGAMALVATTLVACGGSGSGSSGLSGGSGNNPPPATYNLQAGIANMVQKGLSANVSLTGSVTVNGTATPFNGTGTYTLSAAGSSTTFNGNAAYAQKESINGTVNAAGTNEPIATSVTNYYTANTASSFVGEDEGTEFDVAQTPFEWPTSISAGSGGSLGTVLRYTDSTQSVSMGKANVAYSVTAPATTGGPIGVTLTTQIYDTANTLIETDTTSYSMTTSNVISFTGATAKTGSNSLTVTAQ